VLDLARADAEGERAERPVGGRVRVAADDRHARLGDAHLRADHVHDALAGVAHRVQPDAELRRVPAQRLELRAGNRVGHRGAWTLDRRSRADAGVGRDVVVLGGEGQVRPAHLTPGGAQAVEGLGAGDLVHEVQVDEEQVWLTLGAADDVRVPDLLRQRARRAAHAVSFDVASLRFQLFASAFRLSTAAGSQLASHNLRRQYQYMVDTTRRGVGGCPVQQCYLTI
jgi:hypothetical protein